MESQDFLAHRDGHTGVAQAGETFHRSRAGPDGFGNFLLRLEAGGTGAILLSHQGAKWVGRFLPRVRELPGFNGSEGQRQTGGLGESALVILEDLRAR